MPAFFQSSKHFRNMPLWSMNGFFTQFWAFLTNCFAQSAHNFKVIFLTDRTTLWQEFMMHHDIAIEENIEKNLYIWPNLTCFFSFLALLDTSIGMVRLWFQFNSHTPIIRHQLWPFLSKCPCDVVFAKNLAYLALWCLTWVTTRALRLISQHTRLRRLQHSLHIGLKAIHF